MENLRRNLASLHGEMWFRPYDPDWEEFCKTKLALGLRPGYTLDDLVLLSANALRSHESVELLRYAQCRSVAGGDCIYLPCRRGRSTMRSDGTEYPREGAAGSCAAIANHQAIRAS